MYKKRRTYISPIQLQRWNAFIIDCIDSTAYSFFTNPVYISRTSNHLGTISLFSRNFFGKPRKVTRKQKLENFPCGDDTQRSPRGGVALCEDLTASPNSSTSSSASPSMSFCCLEGGNLFWRILST